MRDAVEIAENAIGSDLIDRRSHSGTVDETADIQYFIKNHLCSTVTLIDGTGNPAGPVYDYFPCGSRMLL